MAQTEEDKVRQTLAEMIAQRQSDNLLAEAIYLFGVQMFSIGEVSGMRQIQEGKPALDVAHEAATVIKPIAGMVRGS